MRTLFIFLVVLNICYLIWGVAFSGKKEPTVSEESKYGLQALTLLSEKPEDIVPRSDTEVALRIQKPTFEFEDEGMFEVEGQARTEIDAEVDTIQSRACFSLGPFFEENQIMLLESKLIKGGFDIIRKSTMDKEPKSYWVYIPAAETIEKARLTAGNLKAAEVKDYIVISMGENAKAVSLGLYSSFSRAKLRSEDLKKLGFKALVKTRYKTATRHWLDLQETSAKPLLDNFWIDDDNVVLQKIAKPCVDPLPEISY